MRHAPPRSLPSNERDDGHVTMRKLVTENARLKKLVVELSRLILKHVTESK